MDAQFYAHDTRIIIAEIGAENMYQKTGTGFIRASDMQFVTEFGTCFPLQIGQCSIFVPVNGTSFLVRLYGAGFSYMCHEN